MKAKKYYNKKNSNLNDGRVRLSRSQVISIMEEYTQHDAQERYDKAEAFLTKQIYKKEIRSSGNVNSIIEALRIAAGLI